MLDPNKEYRTRDNELIRIYATDGGPSRAEIHGAIKHKNSWELAHWYNEKEFFDKGNKEYNPLAKLKRGDPIIVWDNDYPNEIYIRIFAGDTYADKPLVYGDGLIKSTPTYKYDNFELLPNYNYGD